MGALNTREIGVAINNLEDKHKENKTLQRVVCAFAFLTVLLVGAIFGASITAARLSQELTVDHANGFAYVKGTHEVMRTQEAITWDNSVSPVVLPNESLQTLKEIVMDDGNVRFQIKGHARDTVSDTVVVLVEGGTMTYDSDGLVEATGEAMALLTAAGVIDENADSGRMLRDSCYVWLGY